MERNELPELSSLAARYETDSDRRFCRDGICIAFGSFVITKESRHESQPYLASSGLVFSWDGRLDNRQELASQLSQKCLLESPDVAIVAAAYESWQTDCFRRFIGDWAMSIWIPSERTLILAKDFLGSRHLYYRIDKDQLQWSTVLDPLVTSANKIELNEEYIAGWFAMFPAAHLTPYKGIHSVPPSSYVSVRGGRAVTVAYWDFDPRKKIRYRTDSEYEEHFRNAFTQSVGRRLCSENPVIAELSGGMDSTSIVCVADQILRGNNLECPRLETVSYYDDSEPNWNERPYFAKVEERRGRSGLHIDVGSRQSPQFSCKHFSATPGSQSPLVHVTEQFTSFMRSHGARVLLSGIGGDEVTGGVPTPGPELADLLSRAHFRWLAHQLKIWAIQQKCPWFHLLFEVVREFMPVPHLWVPVYMRPSPWLSKDFVRRNRSAVYGYPRRLQLFGPEPSFQENLSTLAVLRRHLESLATPSEPHYEKRYPYLDRDLLEFLYAIPREQLVRPGQRRSLMRRALVGIVPEEILNRKRKAYAARNPNLSIVAGWNTLCRGKELASAQLGIVNAEEFAKAVERVRQGHDVPIVHLFRTLAIEAWLSQFPNRAPFRLTDGHAPEALVYTRSAF